MDKLDDPEYDLSLVMDEIEEISSNDAIDGRVQNEIDALKAKYERVREMMQEYRKVEKKKEKVKEEIEIVTSAINKAANAMATCSSQSKLLEERIERRSKRLENEKMRLDSGPDVWKLLGLKCTILDADGPKDDVDDEDGDNEDAQNENNNNPDLINGQQQQTKEGGDVSASMKKKTLQEGNFSFEFSKLDTENLDRIFEVKVRISYKYLKGKNKSCFKIYESNPSDILTSPEIDTIESMAGSDSRHFIILLRKHIESKVQSFPAQNGHKNKNSKTSASTKDAKIDTITKMMAEKVSIDNADAKKLNGVGPKVAPVSKIPKPAASASDA